MFPYTLETLRNITNDPVNTINELLLLQYVYNYEEKYSLYIKQWIFDAFTYVRDYWNAIGYIQSRYQNEYKYFTSRILSLKYAMNIPISGKEILGLLQHRPRKIVLNNEDFVTDYLEDKVRDFEVKYDVDFLSIMTEQFAMNPSINYLFSGTGLLLASEINFFDYSYLGDLSILVNEWVREAENALREMKGLPKIGEGWLNETLLYNIIVSIFKEKGYNVIHHSFPSFLGRLEIDIHIPSFNLGIEYQGIQHYEPIEFFGGQEGFENRIRSDKLKKELCELNGVELIYFSYDEQIDENLVQRRLKQYI